MPEFVRVRDKSTRHEFDVPAAHPQIGKALEVITSDRWPVLSGPTAQARPPKHHVDNKGVTAPPAAVSTTKTTKEG